MAPIRDWTGAITFFPTSPHKIRRSVKSAQWKITVAMIIHCCRNRGWNQKQKHKKTALEQRGMLRIWRRDCALCVIGNVFPCRQPHNHSATLLRGHSTLAQRIKTARRFTAKNP